MHTTLFTYSFSKRIMDQVKRRKTSKIAAIKVNKLGLIPIAGGKGLKEKKMRFRKPEFRKGGEERKRKKKKEKKE